MNKCLLTGLALVTLGVGSATAADLRKAPIRKAPPPPPAFDWSGCYGGFNGGVANNRANVTLSPSGNYLTPAAVPSPPNAAGSGLLPGDIALVTKSFRSRDSGSGIVGVQVGCNRQVGQFVFGGEADIDLVGHGWTRSATSPAIGSVNPAFGIGAQTDSTSARANWLSTVRGRVGFAAADRFLIFVTGGAAIADIRSSTTVAFGPPAGGLLPVLSGATHVGSVSDTRVRPIVGAGAEFAFTDKWSFKVEYLFTDLGHINHVLPLTAPPGVAAGYSWNANVSWHEQIFRVGLNYRFDWAPQVFAKY